MLKYMQTFTASTCTNLLLIYVLAIQEKLLPREYKYDLCCIYFRAPH